MKMRYNFLAAFSSNTEIATEIGIFDANRKTGECRWHPSLQVFTNFGCSKSMLIAILHFLFFIFGWTPNAFKTDVIECSSV